MSSGVGKGFLPSVASSEDVWHGLTTECRDSWMKNHVLCSLCHLIPSFPLLLELPNFSEVLHPMARMDCAGMVDIKNLFLWVVKSWGLFAAVSPPHIYAWQGNIKFHVLLCPGSAALQGGWGC